MPRHSSFSLPHLLKSTDTSPPGLRSLEILGFGGTIMSGRIKKGEKTVIGPMPEAMEFIVETLPLSLREGFTKITTKKTDKLIDSSQATAGHISRMVNIVRERLADPMVDDLLVLSGTDSMSDFVNALGIGIPQKMLGDKSVVVTCAMKHLECQDSDATTNIARSVKLFSDPRSQGKVGLMFGERFFPPRGVEKVTLGEKFPFISRYHRMARYHPEDGEWVFRKPMPYDDVSGSIHPFKMVGGVEEYPLTTTSNYGNIAHAIRNNRATILVALGNGNIRTDQDSIRALRKAAKEARGPVIVVGRAINNSEDAIAPDILDTLYECDASLEHSLISAGAFTVTEIRVLVAHLLAVAGEKSLKQKDRIHDFIQGELALHPFRTHQSSARPRANE